MEVDDLTPGGLDPDHTKSSSNRGDSKGDLFSLKRKRYHPVVGIDRIPFIDIPCGNGDSVLLGHVGVQVGNAKRDIPLGIGREVPAHKGLCLCSRLMLLLMFCNDHRLCSFRFSCYENCANRSHKKHTRLRLIIVQERGRFLQVEVTIPKVMSPRFKISAKEMTGFWYHGLEETSMLMAREYQEQ